MSRPTPTHAVLTGITGRCTPPPSGDGNGFDDYHRLADFYAPGIMTIGLAVRATLTAADIRADLPADFPTLPDTEAMTPDEYVAWAREFCAAMPVTMLAERTPRDPEGPLTDAEKQAWADFGARA